MTTKPDLARAVAVIGMAGRFPGAPDVGTFWANLCAGRDSITPLSDEELLAAGVAPDVLTQPDYVRAAAALDGIDQFDAEFFGFSAHDASLADPQQRLFLECAWHALEDAGHASGLASRAVGVFAGAGGLMSSYLASPAHFNHRLLGGTGSRQCVGSDKDYLATRVSWCLDLCGPSLTVQTACSTSLVAVHLACQSLLAGECDLALAGASTVRVPHRVGYRHTLNPLCSRDGRCRAFSADASGTVFGSGVAAVVLRPLADAHADHDRIYAVIRGTAINNDGAGKISYWASSADGLAAAIAEGLAVAGVDPATVGYVEAHGAGTVLGDPVELQALTRAFRRHTSRRGYCALGSVKTNVGHLEATAGVAGLIKAALCLHHRRIPPSLNFGQPNPACRFEESPFVVNTRLCEWEREAHPRRAGVNSLGIGGTNAHAVLEEAPCAGPPPPPASDRPPHLLLLSAHTPESLRELAGEYARFLARPDGPPLTDVCHTAAVGRRHFPHRAAMALGSRAEAREALERFARGRGDALYLSTAHRDERLVALARRYASGAPLDERELSPHPARKVGLPLYPFQRQSYWIGPTTWNGPLEALIPVSPPDHPLLGNRLDTAGSEVIFRAELSAERPAYLAEHRVFGQAIMPATAFLEMALAAGRALAGDGPLSLERVRFERPLALGKPVVIVQTVLRPANGDWEVEIHSKADGSWVRHAVARLFPGGEPADALAQDLPGARPEDLSAATELARRRGVDYGPPFQVIASLSASEGGAVAELRLAELGPETTSYRAHPVLLDGCLQAAGAVLGRRAGAALIPVGVARLVRLASPGARVRCRVHATGANEPGQFEADVDVWSEAGELAVQFRGVRFHERREWNQISPEALSAWFHRIEWVAQPRSREPDAGHLPRPARLVELLRPWAERGTSGEEWSEHARAQADLEQLAMRHARDALAQLGALDTVFSGGPLDGAAERAGVATGQRRLFARLADVIRKTPRASGRAERLQALRTGEPRADLVERCGRAVPQILRGAINPVEVLFPDGDDGELRRLYSESPEFRLANRLARRAVRELIDHLPEGRAIRLLEVGGGTGATTAAILPELPPDRCRYTFTDVSPHFTTRAAARFAAHPFFRSQVFDAERPAASQGIASASFDVVVASNVLHATADLRQTVRQAAHLLVPGGLLVLVEATTALHWLDLVFGLLPGWWRFTDTQLRPAHALLDPGEWLRVLAEAGLEAECLTPGGATPHASSLSLLLARAPSVSHRGKRLVVSGRSDLSRAVASQLRSSGVRCELDCEAPEGGPPTDVIHLGSAEPPELGTLAADLLKGAAQAVYSGAVECARDLARMTPAPRLWLATRGAQFVGGSLAWPDLPGSLVWGVGRTVTLEHPELRCTRIDLDPQASPEEQARALADEVLADEPDSEVAFRRGARLVSRFTPATDDSLSAPGASPCGLETAGRGTVEALLLAAVPRSPLAADEVRVRIEASGVNFRDLLIALGMYPGQPPLGAEAVGVVEAAGAAVRAIRPGDCVVVLCGGTLAEEVTVPARRVLPCLDTGGWAEAATFPVAYLTAAWGLERLAGLRKGERVLIHSVGGAVGLAAVRLARLLGAEVLATASASRWAALRRHGVEHVASSRTTEFAEDVLAATGGRGVDVVLNSLSGPFIPASLGVLARGGRFIEFGKNGVWTAEEVSRARPDVAYHTVDLLDVLEHQEESLRAVWEDLLSRAKAGRIGALPAQTFPLAQARAAFRHMQHGRHLGKIVLVPRGLRGTDFHADRSYLITGGLGGLGLLLAGWLVERGARNLVLAARRVEAPGAAQAVEALRQRGAAVEVVAADVCERSQVDEVVSRAEGMGPLDGVFHLAGTLDDSPVLRQVDPVRFSRVLWPKVLGAWHLHERTLRAPPRLFVLFSSTASVLGSPGQANHSAANAFLDLLAHARQAMGLPAVSINWGPWSEVGAAADPALLDRFGARGQGAISPESGLAALGEVLRRQSAQVAVVPLERSHHPGAGAPQPGESGSRTTAPPESVPAGDRGAVPRIRRLVQALLNRILGLPEGRPVPPAQGFLSLGLDSLTVVELRNQLQASLGRPLPATLLFDYPNLDSLVAHLERLVASKGEPAAEGPPPAGEAPVSGTRDELLARLQAKIRAHHPNPT